MSVTQIKYQDKAIDVIQRALLADKLSHGYIFLGPEGVGKRTTAYAIGKILLCDSPAKIKIDNTDWLDSCDKCESCKLVDSRTHPDIHIIYKELITLIVGKKKHRAIELGIDLIRSELIEKITFKPYMGKAKIFIIEEAHLMTTQAQNALLKTFEEPPPNTHIFLLTTQVNSLLPTIRSRAQILHFNPLPAEFITQKLEELGGRKEEVEFISKLLPGQLGPAINMLKVGIYQINDKLIKDLANFEKVLSQDLAQWAMELADELAKNLGTLKEEHLPEDLQVKSSQTELNRRAIKLIFSLLGHFFSDAIKFKLGLEENALLNKSYLPSIKYIGQKFDIYQLSNKIKHIREAERKLNANVNVNLLMVDLYNKLISVSDL